MKTKLCGAENEKVFMCRIKTVQFNWNLCDSQCKYSVCGFWPNK